MRKRTDAKKPKMFLPRGGLIRTAYANRIGEANKEDFEREFAARSIFRLLPDNPAAAHRMLAYVAECVDAYEAEIVQINKQRKTSLNARRSG